MERRTRRVAGSLAYDMAAAVMIGVATLFTSKPERDMHWSIPPNFKVLNLRTVEAGQGDPPDAK